MWTHHLTVVEVVISTPEYASHLIPIKLARLVAMSAKKLSLSQYCSKCTTCNTAYALIYFFCIHFMLPSTVNIVFNYHIFSLYAGKWLEDFDSSNTHLLPIKYVHTFCFVIIIYVVSFLAHMCAPYSILCVTCSIFLYFLKHFTFDYCLWYKECLRYKEPSFSFSAC